MGATEMTADEILSLATRLFLDTAPVIYYVERHPLYAPLVDPIFDRLDEGTLTAVTSAVTLGECLVVPCRMGRADVQRDFTDLVTTGRGITFWPVDGEVARRSADLRARYNVAIADAFQFAAAIAAGCDAFLTNDARLKRVREIPVVLVEELAPQRSSPDQCGNPNR